jgi:hypothetical protein
VFSVCWGKRARIVPLHAAKKVTGGFLPYNKADGMDNSSDSINPSFCHGCFQRRWMVYLPPSCLATSLCFSLVLSLSIVPLYHPLLLMLWSPCPHFLSSGHQIISCFWAWFMYSLPEMPAESFMKRMSLKSASCIPVCHPVLQDSELLLQLSENAEVRYGFRSLPSNPKVMFDIASSGHILEIIIS